MLKLSFMTFVCPEWKIEKIVEFTRQAGYDGVEIRVDAGHGHGVSSNSSVDERRYIKGLFRDQAVQVSCIATSEAFGFPDPIKRRENIEAAKANVKLAADLGAGVIRIFAGGGIPKLTDEAADYVAEAFTELGDYAAGYGVCPLLESGHDIIVSVVETAEVVRRVKTPNFGINWNHSDMGQRALELLKNHIRHFHIHEEVLPWSVFSRERIWKDFPQDNRNILHLAKKMKSINFDGYFSLEIIKGQLPEELLIETAKRLRSYITQA